MEIRKQKDEHIRNALSQEATQIEPGKNLFNKIGQSIYEKEASMTTKKRVQGIKKGNKLVAVAALCMLLGAITIFGATMGRSWISHGRITYTSFPSKEKIQKDVGFVPKYIDTLPGGFKYNSGGNGESQLEDENGSTLTKTKYIMLSYMRNNEKRPLSFHASQIEENFIDNTHNQIVGNYKGVALYYHEKDYKFVPVNYENKLSELDKSNSSVD